MIISNIRSDQDENIEELLFNYYNSGCNILFRCLFQKRYPEVYIKLQKLESYDEEFPWKSFSILWCDQIFYGRKFKSRSIDEYINAEKHYGNNLIFLKKIIHYTNSDQILNILLEKNDKLRHDFKYSNSYYIKITISENSNELWMLFKYFYVNNIIDQQKNTKKILMSLFETHNFDMFSWLLKKSKDYLPEGKHKRLVKHLRNSSSRNDTDGKYLAILDQVLR